MLWCIARNAFLTSLRRTVSQRTAQGICRAWKCCGDWRTLCPPAHGDVHTYKERRWEVEQQIWNFGQIWALILNAFWSSLHLYCLWFAAMSKVVITDYFTSRGESGCSQLSMGRQAVFHPSPRGVCRDGSGRPRKVLQDQFTGPWRGCPWLHRAVRCGCL